MLQRRARVRVRTPITHLNLTRAPAARRTAGKPSGSRAGTRQQPPRAAGATSCCRKLGAPASPAFPPSCRQAGPLRPAPTSPGASPGCGTQKNGLQGGSGKRGDSSNQPPPGGGGYRSNLAAPGASARSQGWHRSGSPSPRKRGPGAVLPPPPARVRSLAPLVTHFREN